MLDVEHSELNLWTLYTEANNLQTNFCEEHMQPKKVKEDSEAVKELIEKLRRIRVA